MFSSVLVSHIQGPKKEEVRKVCSWRLWPAIYNFYRRADPFLGTTWYWPGCPVRRCKLWRHATPMNMLGTYFRSSDSMSTSWQSWLIRNTCEWSCDSTQEARREKYQRSGREGKHLGSLTPQGSVSPKITCNIGDSRGFHTHREWELHKWVSHCRDRSMGPEWWAHELAECFTFRSLM